MKSCTRRSGRCAQCPPNKSGASSRLSCPAPTCLPCLLHCAAQLLPLAAHQRPVVSTNMVFHRTVPQAARGGGEQEVAGDIVVFTDTRVVPPISRRTSHRQVYAVGLLLPLLTGSAWVWLGDYHHPAFVWILHVQAQHAVVRPCQGILDVAWVPSHATRPRRCSGKKKKKNSWSHRARAAGGYGYSKCTPPCDASLNLCDSATNPQSRFENHPHLAHSCEFE